MPSAILCVMGAFFVAIACFIGGGFIWSVHAQRTWTKGTARLLKITAHHDTDSHGHSRSYNLAHYEYVGNDGETHQGKGRLPATYTIDLTSDDHIVPIVVNPKNQAKSMLSVGYQGGYGCLFLLIPFLSIFVIVGIGMIYAGIVGVSWP